MGIHFDKTRMEKVIDSHELWWNKRLNRPLVKGTVLHAYAPSHTAEAPFPTQANSTDLSRTPEQVIDAWDANLSTQEYVADGYPYVNFDVFGPGVVAAFCGSKIDNSTGRIWFMPVSDDISQIHVQYDPENVWSRRIKALYKAGLERWNGSVIMGFPDLGGVLDILASLYGSENLLIALLDEPEEVHRLIGEIETAWNAAYDDFAQILAPQGAYTDWNGILSRTPGYITQCDFAYMISPDMFREFALDTLRKDTEKLSNVIYHLDGIGELVHLDMLLGIEKLKAVQWVPGDGKPGTMHWLDVYKRILNAGKQIMIKTNAMTNHFLDVADQLHCSPYSILTVDPAEHDPNDVQRILDRL